MPPGRGNPPGGGGFPAGGANAGRDDVEFLPRTPVYIPVTITFDDVAFHNVGLRLKGNSRPAFPMSRSQEWFSEARSAPDPARTMNPVLAMRLQFELP